VNREGPAGAANPDLAGPAGSDPVPVPGCDRCRALARQRDTARALGRPDIVRTCNGELRNHPHRKAILM
jgi:hypothetical protein